MEEKDVLVRFGVSMSQDLVNQFDKMIAVQGYANRSEAIRDLVRKALIQPHRLQATETVAGTISVVYDHHYLGLPGFLMDLQHDYCNEIVSAMHVHLNHSQCLEMIVVRGVLNKLNQLCEQIQVQRGVVYAELAVTHVDAEEQEHHSAHSHD